MTTLGLILLIVIVGVVFYLVPGIDGNLKKLIYVILAILVLIWLLSIVGVIDDGGWSRFDRRGSGARIEVGR